jgi:DNA-binding response OmpR family regulator
MEKAYLQITINEPLIGINMKLLIIEDDVLIRKTVEMKFRKEGFDVVVAIDGKDGMEKFQTTNPDIVLTDIMLPYLSGLEIVRVIKSMPNRSIPVIVFSTMGQETMVEEAYRLGADEFVKKPFSLAELAIRVKRLTKN